MSSSDSSSGTTNAFNPNLRIKVEPKLPEQLTIEGPGQAGITADYVVGAVETLAAYLRTLPPNQDKLEIKNLQDQLENAEKEINTAAEKAKQMEEKIARLEKEKLELERRVQRRNQTIEKEQKARKNNYCVYKKKLADSENEKNGLLNILEGMRKMLPEPVVKPVSTSKSSVSPTPKPSMTSPENQKPGAVPSGSKCFAKPAALPSNLASVSTTPQPSPIPLVSSHLPANSEPFDIVPTVRLVPFTVPNREYAGWGRRVPESNSEEELKNQNQVIKKLKSFSRPEPPKSLKDQVPVPSIPLPTKASSPSSKKEMRSRPY